MQTSQPRGKLVLRSSHRSLRIAISHAGSASSWTPPSKDDKRAAPPKPGRR